MNRKALLWILICAAVVAGAYFVRQKKLQAKHFQDDPVRQVQPQFVREDVERRVDFVCCDDYGNYSPIIYCRCGGGMSGFQTIVEAAPYMRPGDPHSAAAGLCGFLFRGYDGDTGGTLSVDPPPDPQPDGTINWAKVGGNCDVFVINVDTCSGKCTFGTVLGREIHDLPLGRRAKMPR
jgi:hypothetical protein